MSHVEPSPPHTTTCVSPWPRSRSADLIAAASTAADANGGRCTVTPNALTGQIPAMIVQHDAGITIRVQLDDLGTVDVRRRYRITVDAPGADYVEIGADHYPVGAASGNTRFELEYEFFTTGERALVVRAFASGQLIGYRLLKVYLTPP